MLILLIEKKHPAYWVPTGSHQKHGDVLRVKLGRIGLCPLAGYVTYTEPIRNNRRSAQFVDMPEHQL